MLRQRFGKTFLWEKSPRCFVCFIKIKFAWMMDCLDRGASFFFAAESFETKPDTFFSANKMFFSGRTLGYRNNGNNTISLRL